MAAEAEKKRPEDRTEQERVAIMGKPRLGDITRAQIRIKESKEFKVTFTVSVYSYICKYVHKIAAELSLLSFKCPFKLLNQTDCVLYLYFLYVNDR